jgi:hypothetical protein
VFNKLIQDYQLQRWYGMRTSWMLYIQKIKGGVDTAHYQKSGKATLRIRCRVLHDSRGMHKQTELINE